MTFEALRQLVHVFAVSKPFGRDFLRLAQSHVLLGRTSRWLLARFRPIAST
jgi:hypothetical protein